MTRSEYLSELDSHLISLPKEERDMAVSFYEEYFDEAGPENEQAVIADLGKPFSLARSIIGETSAYSKSTVYLKYKESKPMPQNNTSVFASLRKPEAFEQDAPAVDTAEDIMPQQNEPDVSPRTNNSSGMFDEDYIKPAAEDKTPKKETNTGVIILLIVLGVILGLPLIASAFALIVSIIAVMFSFGIVSAVCFIIAIILLITGLIQLPASLVNGMAVIFAAVFAAGVGMILLSAALAFFCKFLPWIFKGIGKLFKKRRYA